MDFASNPILNLPPLTLLALLSWSLVWKGLSLWRAAKMQDKTWFVALLILNTVGILDIIYLQFLSRKGKKK